MNIEEIVAKQRGYFNSGKTKPISFRLDSLSKLKTLLTKNEKAILDALQKDLNKSAFEAFATELGFLLAEISFAQKHLKTWAKPQKAKTPLTHFGSNSWILAEPYGVVLIIAPWNYPLNLTLAPLIGAMAAGNCAIVKPSELTPYTSEVLAKLINNVFPTEYLQVVEGGIETSTMLLTEKLDYIFFTGSERVGKIVMQAAAEQLTPVTLELGGKSPCLVDQDANLALAAKRIVWGKFTNAGQTCVAPDYLLVHQSIKDRLLQLMVQSIGEFFGPAPLSHKELTRIISVQHFNRLCSFLTNGRLVTGGTYDKDKLALAPTILDGVTWHDPVMQEEIFGPILPVLAYENLSEAIEHIKARPKPLALYLFSNNRANQAEVTQAISFGGGCINDTIMHLANPHLPFGGVGSSGIGGYHGKFSFDLFSHQKSVLKQTTAFDFPFRYPNSKSGLAMLRRLLR